MAATGFLYLFQRKLIYYPVANDAEFSAQPFIVNNLTKQQSVELHGWVLNPGQSKALIYFGGNAEQITARQAFLTSVFHDYSIYLVNYRGFGRSQGTPSETALFSDALAIYDQIKNSHQSITVYGRSLGSGVAVYLATQRKLKQLLLLTPYDSVTQVAQQAYPIFPVGWLLKDHFNSAAYAGEVKVPVLISIAEQDKTITMDRSLSLQHALVNAEVSVSVIAGAAHNDVVEFPQYRAAVQDFIGGGTGW